MVTSEAGFAELTERLQAHASPIEQGLVTRWGVKGNGASVYLLDPEGNRGEVRYYPLKQPVPGGLYRLFHRLGVAGDANPLVHHTEELRRHGALFR